MTTRNTYGVDVGAADAISAYIGSIGYYDGQTATIKVSYANTTAVTVSLDGKTAKALKKLHNQALVAGDLEAGQIIDIVYNATEGVFQLQSPLAQ